VKEKILVTKSSMPEFEEYIETIRPIWDSHWLTNMGQYHNELMKQLKEYLEVDRLELFTNGHMALELTLQAFDLQGEVITTPFTFASTTHAIVRNGLTPIFCDINPEDYTIDVNKIEALITEKTCAIVPVHVYGNICDVEAIEKIAKKHNLKVIYDAAHAFGVRYKNRGIASYGDASMFSFHATKVFNTIEGGGVAFKAVGANAKMNEFQAAMGICNLRHLDTAIQKRKKIVERYNAKLIGIDGIKLNASNKDTEMNYAYYPIVIDQEKFGTNRDAVCDALKENNIFARKYFYPLTNSFKCYEDKYDVSDTPVAEYISNRVITLPLYEDLDLEDVDRICDIILACRR
jgi:dTDP-4-amino-4,6-dideoxygalactose transaminase